MKCKDIKRNLSAYLDGELPPAMGDAFFDHLQTCHECCDLVGEASFHESLIANSLKVHITAPASLRYNVLSAISREKARPVPAPAWRRIAWRPATAMAAMLALAGTGWRTFTLSLPPATKLASNVVEIAPTAPPAQHKVVDTRPAPRPVVPTETPAKTRPEVIIRATAETRTAPTPPKSENPVVAPAAARTMVALAPIGRVTNILTGDNIANGRFLSRIDGQGQWQDAPSNLAARTHLQTSADTIVTLELVDGTVIRSNQHTDFVIQRSPSKDDPSWEIRLVRGELWVKTSTNVKVVSPSMETHSTGGEFSVRCMDGEDSTAIVVGGLVACHNSLGTTLVGASQAAVAVSGESPRDAFSVEDARGQMDWVYAPAPAHNPQDDGGTQS